MMQPDPNILTKAVDVIVSAVNPLRIILFGSGARGQLRVDSDLDLMVVVKNGAHRRNTAREIRKVLRVFDNNFDVVVATEDDLKKYGDNFSLVYYPALREGRTIYAA
jgi:predicted nucleotidyltransferase